MYCVPDIHCKLLMVGRGGVVSSGLIITSLLSRPLSIPQTGTTTISDGPAQPTTSPVLATMLLVRRLESNMPNGALLISFRPGKLNALTVLSPNVATKAKPCSSNSVTAAASQRTSSNDLDAPLEAAGLKMRISLCVTDGVSRQVNAYTSG